jgi:hypothetical protein
MLHLTIKVCEFCGKKFPFSFSAWSDEVNEIMNRQFKNHVYYCGKHLEFVNNTYLRNGIKREKSDVESN